MVCVRMLELIIDYSGRLDLPHFDLVYEYHSTRTFHRRTFPLELPLSGCHYANVMKLALWLGLGL